MKIIETIIVYLYDRKGSALPFSGNKLAKIYKCRPIMNGNSLSTPAEIEYVLESGFGNLEVISEEKFNKLLNN